MATSTPREAFLRDRKRVISVIRGVIASGFLVMIGAFLSDKHIALVWLTEDIFLSAFAFVMLFGMVLLWALAPRCPHCHHRIPQMTTDDTDPNSGPDAKACPNCLHTLPS